MKQTQKLKCDWEGCLNPANINDFWGDFVFCDYHNSQLYAGLEKLVRQEQLTKKQKMPDEKASSKETQV